MNTIFKALDPRVTRAVARAGLQLQKYSPEILVGIGVIGFVTTVVMASKATLKLKPIIDDHEEKIDDLTDEYANINELEEKAEIKLEKEFAQKITRTYLLTTKELAFLYGPSILIGVGSIGCFLGSYGILKDRNANLMAAYGVLQATFNEYRKKTIASNDANGHEIDKETLRSIKAKVSKKKKDGSTDPDFDSPYAMFFDEYSVHYKRDARYNLEFLNHQQNYANDLLRANGHLFLGDVLKSLGLPPTKAGQVCGWVYNKTGNSEKDMGDNYVDFGIHLPRNNGFVTGEEPSILLNFNVDGVIVDLIWINNQTSITNLKKYIFGDM